MLPAAGRPPRRNGSQYCGLTLQPDGCHHCSSPAYVDQVAYMHTSVYFNSKGTTILSHSETDMAVWTAISGQPYEHRRSFVTGTSNHGSVLRQTHFQ